MSADEYADVFVSLFIIGAAFGVWLIWRIAVTIPSRLRSIERAIARLEVTWSGIEGDLAARVHTGASHATPRLDAQLDMIGLPVSKREG